MKASKGADSDVPTTFAKAADFETWLQEHHASSDGIWVRIAKRGSGQSTVTYEEAVEAALCFGWIDGQKGRGDGDSWLQRFSPRRKASRWSRKNRETAERLLAAGRMTKAGIAEVERARADGRWDLAYEGQARATVPDDLAKELEKDPELAAAFESLDRSSRFSIIWRINDARRPETRARRVAHFIEMLRTHERP